MVENYFSLVHNLLDHDTLVLISKISNSMVQYGKLETTIQAGMEKIYQYMDKCAAAEGFLLVINKAKKVSWQKKIFKKTMPYKDTQIIVFGM